MTWEARNQRDALAPILWLNWIFGLGVFELARRPRYKLTIIYNLICTIIYFTILYWVKLTVVDSWVAYQEITYSFVLWINIIVALTSILLGFVNREKSRRIIARCEQIDNTLEPLGVEKDYTRTLRNSKYGVFAWSILMLSLCAVDTFWLINETNYKLGIYLCILIYPPLTINSVVIVSFCTFIRILDDKLRKINVAMNEILQLPNVKNFNIKYGVQPYMVQKIIVTSDHQNQQRFILHFLQVTRHVHLEIIRISRELNQVYCYQLLLQLIVEFTLLTGGLYNIFFNILQSDIMKAMTNKSTYALFIWIFINSTKTIVINNFCTDLRRQARVTTEVLRELGNSYLDDSIKDEMEQFSLQLILHPLYFSAGGFVSLDNKFTTVFFGTITTYIAILLQMSFTPDAMKSLTQIL